MQNGTVVGHYRIVSKLGEGGMGQVFRAEDTRLKREVAIKVLPAELAGDPERIARMEREAQVLASLEHPNIAAIYGIEQADVDGTPVRFLAMQLAEGATLADRIAESPIPLSESLQIALQIAQGLEAAHERGIVHRDLKPANIQLGSDGTVKLLDFGLAKAVDGKAATSGMDLTASPTVLEATKAGVILGTAAYMSPEQARGYKVDQRTDIWAFGAVVYEMLAGRTLFGGETATDVLGGIVHKEPEWNLLPGDTPQRIRMLLKRCLRKDPKRRLQAIGDARVTILDYLEDPAAAEAFVGAAAVPAWQRWLPWGVAAAALLALGAVNLMSAAPESTPATRMRVEMKLDVEGLLADLGSNIVVSPDGRFLLAGTGQLIGGEQIFVRSLRDPKWTELVGQGAYAPFFSPDAEWVGFVRSDGLFKVPTAGGTAQHLMDVARSRGATWLSDGRIVLAPSPGSALVTVSENGGEPTPLTELDEAAGEVTHRWPAVVPDTNVLLYVAHSELSGFDGAVIKARNLDTGEEAVAARGGTYPHYLPSGHLVYVNDGTLFAVRFDPATLQTSGSAVPVLENVSADSQGSAEVSFSSTGIAVYQASSGGMPEHPLTWVDRQGVQSPLWETLGTYAEPRVSPDGKRVAVIALDDGNWDVWVYDTERDVATRLTFDEAEDGPGVWSPDGRYVIFSSARDGAISLYRKRSDGSGDVERLTESQGPAQYVSDWSSSSRYVIFTDNTPSGADLHYLDLENPEEVQVFLATEFNELEAELSPDERWLAYESNETGTLEIYVRPFPSGGGKWQVSDGGGAYPHWSADGSELYYRDNGGIISVPVSAGGDALTVGRPRQLFTGAFRGGLFGFQIGGNQYADYDAGPDGRFVMMSDPEASTAANVELAWMVTGFFEELRERVPGDR